MAPHSHSVKHAKDLLDPDFLQQLERLRFSRKGISTDRELGEGLSRRHGTSVEFAEYREYQPGDDFRNIDWNMLARLDRLFVKLFQAEENLCLELCIDASTSMHFGRPTKFEFAIRLAAALGYIALRRGDRAAAAFFGQTPLAHFPAARGRHATAGLFHFLVSGSDAGTTDINSSLIHLARQTSHRGLAVLISDLLDVTGYERGVDALLQSGRQVALIHLLSPEELNPETTGDFEWLDSETRGTLEISVDRDTLALYQEALSQWVGEIRAFCTTRRIPYFGVATDTPVEDLVLRHLRQGGLLV